ncbi:MAG: DUF2089 domain-containing protein [bacterium]|nr:DUF2089 domain-containing protein [bacterium]
MKNHLNTCPKCSSNLKISEYSCPACGTIIEGDFQGCQFCNLEDEDRLFALVFLQTEGNMKDVERLMGISYPTIKSKLRNINNKLEGTPHKISLKLTIDDIGIHAPLDTKKPISSEDKASILDRLASGDISAETASKLLRGELISEHEPGISD